MNERLTPPGAEKRERNTFGLIFEHFCTFFDLCSRLFWLILSREGKICFQITIWGELRKSIVGATTFPKYPDEPGSRARPLLPRCGAISSVVNALLLLLQLFAVGARF